MLGMATESVTESAVVDIDKLDLEDKLNWVKEILENGRDALCNLQFGDKLMVLVDQLAENKVISGYNKMNLKGLKAQSDIIEELIKILKTKGWDNFKTARGILYEMFPDLKEAAVWDENHIDDLPVLTIKYSEEDGTASTSTEVEHDGNVPNPASAQEGIADTDGMFASRSKDEPSKSQPVTRSELSALPAYNMTKRRHKGICLIINNENYTKARSNKKEFKDRRGSTKDADSLKQIFGKLGFYVEYQKDVSKAKMDKLIDMMVKFQGLNTYSCFVAIFLSHGENECLNCVDGQDKKIDDIINSFKGDNCSALKGIPKWFIIQACRGKDFNYEVTTEHDAHGSEDGNDVERQSDKPISIPACADFYISYATAPGYFSFRNINEGSWFINDLCSVLETYAHREDVNTMMTRVNRNVALGRCVQSDFGYRRQMPCHVNMLTSALYLHRNRASEI